MTICNCGPSVLYVTGSGGFKIGGKGTADINAYEGSGGALGGCSATVSVPTSVYDSYAFVYHLLEQGTGQANEYKNSQGYLGGQGDSGDNTNNIPTQTAGIWFDANSFDGGDYITCPQDSMPNDGPITVSLWAKINGKYQYRYWFSRGATHPDAHEGWSITLGHTLGNQLTGQVQVQATSTWKIYTAIGTSIIDSCWHHVALVWQPSTSLSIYLDGVLEKSVSISEGKLVPSNSGHFLGRVNGRAYALSTVQEVKLAPVARSQAWLAAEAANLCAGNGFYAVSAEQNLRYSLTT